MNGLRSNIGETHMSFFRIDYVRLHVIIEIYNRSEKYIQVERSITFPVILMKTHAQTHCADNGVLKAKYFLSKVHLFFYLRYRK